MTCVNACPDTAILGVALPESQVETAIDGVRRDDRRSGARRGRPPGATSPTPRSTPRSRRSRARSRPAFGIFVDPVHCKGCAECVEVCHALGYDALRMIDKVEAEPSGESTLERYSRDMRLFRSLPPTPVEYRNEQALADLMLGEQAIGYVGGAGSCAGCGEATAIRMLLAATRQVHGPESMGIVAATGCNTVFGSTYPFNPYLVPWTNSLFENAPAVALGIRARWDQAGHPERRLWVLGGDGAMYDIGFQSLSRMVAAGADIKVLVLDTQVYSNTGGQASTASFGGQVTKLSAFGKALHGPARAAQGARPDPDGPRRGVRRPDDPGPHQPLLPGGDGGERVSRARRSSWPTRRACPSTASPTTPSTRQAKLAVESRAFPLFVYDPRKGPSIAERLSLTGNPAVKEDWAKEPDGTPIDFLAFARTRGPVRARTSPRTARRRRRSRRPRRTGWRTGTPSRSWPACAEVGSRGKRPREASRRPAPRRRAGPWPASASASAEASRGG